MSENPPPEDARLLPDVARLLPTILERLPVAVVVLDRDGTPVYSNVAAQKLLGPQLAPGYQARLAGTDEPYPMERTPIVRALAGETATVADMELYRDDGATPVEVWATPIFASDGTVASAVAVFRDISERRRAEIEAAVLSEETVRQGRWLAAVREVQFSILAGADFDAALDLVARRAREVIGGDSTSIGIPGGDGFLEIRAADGEAADQLRAQRASLAGSIMGAVIEMGASALLDDAASHGGVTDPIGKLDLGPAVFVPLTATGGAFGSLCVARRRGAPLFTEREVALAEAFAVQAAMAVQVGQASHAGAGAAVISDRERTANDLHEAIVRSLSVVKDGLLATADASGDAALAAQMAEAASALDAVVRQVRTYASSLRR